MSGRDHKRLCGFVFLRTLRTGSRALSLQRGSLLDTVLRLGGTGLADMWQDTLDRLQGMKPPIGEVPQLKQIRADIRERMARFVSLAPGGAATAFFASELTRENLREACGCLSPPNPSATACVLRGSGPVRSTCWFLRCSRLLLN
ncbi:hypothetical protein [Bradyrhizobium canariense]|uniref:hypothetical protein n=1 Tax=Bradyrhizobium canariense TaxID=255045 RepID=UPI001F0A6927|nr:hypothetical protein [Bradyrhizobium canariense]